jgi:hypothetical protein
MSITFNQFLSRIDEAFPTWGSSPRRDKPTGQLSPRSRTRGRTGPTLDWRASEPTKKEPKPQKPGGGVSYMTVAPEIEKPEPPQKKETPKPQRVLEPWIPGIPAHKDLKVKPYKKPKLKKPEKRPKTPKPRTRQLTLKLKEFINLYRQSIID